METKTIYNLAHKYLAYETGTGYLIRKINAGTAWKAGEIAGTLHHSRGLEVYLGGKKHFVHRLIFLMHNGRWPVDQIDHINGIRGDNRIENLREVDHSENMKNIATPITNTSGVMGVVRNNGKWQAQIRTGKTHKYLGIFADINDAIRVRKAAEIEYGFHENHGRKGIHEGKT